MADPSWLSTSPHAILLKSIRAIAWSDGTLAEEEKIFMERLILRLGLSPSAPELRLFWLQPEMDERFVPAEQDHFSRLFLLSKAVEMSYEDGAYSAQEKQLVQCWAEQWSIEAGEVEALEARISASHSADTFL